VEKEIRVIRTDVAEIWLENNNILWSRILEGTELNLEAMQTCFSVYRQLCGDRKVLQVIDSMAICTMTTEGKEYSARHSPDLFIATALITDQLSIRLLVNFYNKLHHHSVPFEIFKTEEEARLWLKQYGG
jgi:hypothetical protein